MLYSERTNSVATKQTGKKLTVFRKSLYNIQIGFASLRKSSPFVSGPQHPFAVSRSACLVCHLSYWDGNSLRTNEALSFPVPFFLCLFYLCTDNSSASLVLASGDVDCVLRLRTCTQLSNNSIPTVPSHFCFCS